jgi:hypothetical protein
VSVDGWWVGSLALTREEIVMYDVEERALMARPRDDPVQVSADSFRHLIARQVRSVEREHPQRGTLERFPM